MRLNKLYSLLIVVSCFIIQNCTAQINMVYSMGVVGNTNAKQPVYSGTVVIDGKACFNLANGVKTFEKTKNGLFTNSCTETNPGVVERKVIKLNLRVFPNPVVTTVTVKSLDLIQVPDALLVTVYNMSGQLVKTAKTNFSEIGKGLVMDLGGLKTGIYVLKVSSQSASAEFKLIKVD